MTDKLRWGILGCASIAMRAVIPGIRASGTGAVDACLASARERRRVAIHDM
ncbi:hypothetical protein M5W83_12505 [Paenibacillus thiaminolyticus]|uniref:Gfo/Idh/MocA family oxidoreductase n=1 Tax=Paenibacillus thiaminolyticus TaxID=49283 RepID=A0ABT4FZ06_PANTH|nr:hypothetical protein [Paenibacillus thiaminolyticus]MCY9537108.1 hypothetical protein [Paenibacillus thiaminolyticus]MCY9603133.1 hypothetical protein [Paenibacillus thiaminolyticus]MCY9607963.1 hypothetical protein [Paenibacillus thiaminolyticus]MCY9613580.1 hypothetical protein [Paenibacillus thiaminolyticus]MCY9618742.1 hypothetical protein [Paenibacillus thiaminolyticus]